MADVIILASTPQDGEHVAYYLRTAFPAINVFVYNYTNATLYRWNNHANLNLVGFANAGQMQHGNLYNDITNIVGQGGNADQTTAAALRRYSKKVGVPGDPNAQITVLNYTEFTERGYTRTATRIIQDLMARNQDEKCFVICPNARNLPPQFLTFGHKLDYLNGALTYTSSNNKPTFDINHLNMTKADVACAMTELALCSAIIETPTARYLGNCFGSQVMWMALGGGLTTYRRNAAVQHNGTIVANALGSHVNVDWDSVYLGDNAGNAPVNQLSVQDLIALFAPANFQIQQRIANACHQGDLVYNTDFHHGFMLITSSETQDEVNRGKLVTLHHPLSQSVAQVQLGNQPQRHQSRFVRYSQTGGGSKYSWEGIYGYDGRIYGFQGHPLYHLTQRSTAWDGNLQNVAQGTQNAHYLNNRRLMENCLFDRQWQ